MMAVRRLGKRASPCGLGCLAGPFLDGELTAGEARRYLRHLARCPECRAELRTIRRLSQLLRAWGRPGPWETGPEDALEVEPRRESRAERPSPQPIPTASLACLAPGGGLRGRP